MPERGTLLRRCEIVRAHDRVDEAVDARALRLDVERITMCIRHHDQTFAASSHARQEFLRSGKEADALAVLALQHLQVHAKITRPMIEAVPLERADLRVETRRELSLRVGHGHATQARIALWH